MLSDTHVVQPDLLMSLLVLRASAPVPGLAFQPAALPESEAECGVEVVMLERGRHPVDVQSRGAQAGKRPRATA